MLKQVNLHNKCENGWPPRKSGSCVRICNSKPVIAQKLDANTFLFKGPVEQSFADGSEKHMMLGAKKTGDTIQFKLKLDEHSDH